MGVMRGQGAVEYLFMIALVMVVVLLAVAVLNKPTTANLKSVSHSADFSGMQSQVELIAQKYNNSSWWELHKDSYNACIKGDKSACEEILNEYPNG